MFRHCGNTFGAFEEQEDEYGESDEEVGGAVINVPELDEPGLGEEDLLQRLLVEQTERPLEPNDVFGIVECGLRNTVRRDLIGTEAIADP